MLQETASTSLLGRLRLRFYLQEAGFHTVRVVQQPVLLCVANADFRQCMCNLECTLIWV